MKKGICGTLESSDALIMVEESDTLEIKIESIVFDAFGDAILKVIKDVLNDFNITNIKVVCTDKGALDYTIKSRLITAIKRMESSK